MVASKMVALQTALPGRHLQNVRLASSNLTHGDGARGILCGIMRATVRYALVITAQ